MCILLKSPVRSCTVTSVTRPMTFDGSSAGVSPITWRLNISGASRLNQPFAFHLSFTLRAEVRVGCFAMGSPPRSRGPYKTFRARRIPEHVSSASSGAIRPSNRTSHRAAPPPEDELRRHPEGRVHGEDQDDLQLLEGLIAPTIGSYAIGAHGRGCSRHGAPTRCAWSREIRRRLLQARETGGPPSWRRGPPDSDGILARRARDSEKRSWRYSGVLRRGARPEVRKKCRRGV